MQLFDSPPSADIRPARHSEPHAAYLARTGRPEFVGIREFMELWVAEVPHPHRQPLITRLRSPDDRHFQAAFFELYIHALLRRLGHAVQIHPRAGERGRRPDFLAAAGDGKQVLVEAAKVEPPSAAGRAAKARLDTVYDALDGLEVPDYYLTVEALGELETPLPGRRLRREVRRFLEGLDYEAVRGATEIGDFTALPRMAFPHVAFRLEISVLPVGEERRGDHRPIRVLGPGEARWMDDRTPIRDKVREKARRYGALRRPLVVAVNAAGRHFDEIDAMEALFVKEEAPGREQRAMRGR